METSKVNRRRFPLRYLIVEKIYFEYP